MASPLGHLRFVDGRGISTDVLRRQIEDDSRDDSPENIPPWLQAPDSMDDAARQLWTDMVISRGIEWFKPSDVHFLREMVNCRADVDTLRDAWRANIGDPGLYRVLSAALMSLDRIYRALGVRLADRLAESNRDRLHGPKAKTSGLADSGRANIDQDAEEQLLQRDLFDGLENQVAQ